MNRALAVVVALAAVATPARPQRIADLTVHEGDVPVRLVGYGLVVGLDGTGDRSFGSVSGPVMTVQSVANLLRRFDIEVPSRHM
ncbi:MAG TPA: flagellar basal body P-ring protein FlgI, partial [Gemmatimonadaceae bacterium]|nr:flagellar basal body P-ring protein FlgI [Gemmatimonadaceae bacterium]